MDALHWGALFQIVAIDILLGGDNAVVIAMACRGLPAARRRLGIIWGTVGAIVLRVLIITFALALLDLPWLRLVGGLTLFWIGIRLLAPADESPGALASGGVTLAAVIKTIIIADLVMSLDNVIAIAAAASNAHIDHQMYYVIFGLLVSVPIIIWGSTLVLRLIDRFPLVVTAGGALLGWIAAGLMVSDAVVLDQLQHVAQGAWVSPDASGAGLVPHGGLKIGLEIFGAAVVVGIGKWLNAKRQSSPSKG